MRRHRHVTLALALTIMSATAACDKVKSAYCTSVAPSLANICTDQITAEFKLEKGGR